jgi:hypothetical protein
VVESPAWEQGNQPSSAQTGSGPFLLARKRSPAAWTTSSIYKTGDEPLRLPLSHRTVPASPQLKMSASPGTRQASDPGKEVHALSCVNCRQRKVKCSKTYPCPHCLRGGLECIFPSRKKDRRPRTNRNHELLNRLAKLEAIVGQVDPDAVSAGSGHPPVAAGPPGSALEAADKAVARSAISPAQQVAESELRNPQKRCPTTQPVSRDDPSAKYVSGEFWE